MPNALTYTALGFTLGILTTIPLWEYEAVASPTQTLYSAECGHAFKGHVILNRKGGTQWFTTLWGDKVSVTEFNCVLLKKGT